MNKPIVVVIYSITNTDIQCICTVQDIKIVAEMISGKTTFTSQLGTGHSQPAPVNDNNEDSRPYEMNM